MFCHTYLQGSLDASVVPEVPVIVCICHQQMAKGNSSRNRLTLAEVRALKAEPEAVLDVE